MDATLLRLFGTKLKAYVVVSVTLVLITLSTVLKGTQWENIFFIFALIVPVLFSLPNMMNNPEPKEVRILLLAVPLHPRRSSSRSVRILTGNKKT